MKMPSNRHFNKKLNSLFNTSTWDFSRRKIAYANGWKVNRVWGLPKSSETKNSRNFVTHHNLSRSHVQLESFPFSTRKINKWNVISPFEFDPGIKLSGRRQMSNIVGAECWNRVRLLEKPLRFQLERRCVRFVAFTLYVMENKSPRSVYFDRQRPKGWRLAHCVRCVDGVRIEWQLVPMKVAPYLHCCSHVSYLSCESSQIEW